ncbi:MAG TPA: hypothetical protein VGR78_06615, partial [Verrucomicrobiae bacterium]|nr:hypothetical protein [Verrucomicrobiae bacterium]
MNWTKEFAVLLSLMLSGAALRAQNFRITSVGLNTNVGLNGQAEFTVTHESAPDSYYLLYRGPSPTNIPQVVALALGQNGSGELKDQARRDGAAYYRVRQVPQAQSLDVDADGLPDVYELQHPTFLNPLNAADASLDYDGDGKSNLQEYIDKTDPAKLPVDPVGVATPLKLSGNTSLADATKFLYTGANPIQAGVAAGTFDTKRLCVLRGKVFQRDNSVLPGATITISDHPEFGQTKTRADGMFDLAVNGGGQLTVKFERPGYCPVQRQVVTPWTDYLCLPDVILMAMDPVANPVTLGNNSFQLARGSAQTDGDGARQATLLLSAGTSANLVVNGAAQKVNSLNIRATEFTVGTKGSATMPAPLPGNSAFTYCVELSADEAVAAGASTVQFDRPLYFYVENFLGFPAGQAVPTGYFDRDKKAWVASPNGRVIKVLSVSNGIAAVDANGDGGPDSAAELGSLGFTDEELRRVASLYVPGQTLWRVAVTHFSPWDCNWPGGPPPDAKSPPTPGGGPNPDDNCPGSGSIIQIERQSLGEAVDIVGTHFQLHYHSRRARGYLPPYTLRIPLSENSIPASLKRIDLQIEVAGRLFNQSFSPTTNQLFVFTWDGLDAYGRTLAGSYPVTVRLGYVYPASYYLPGQFEQAFARFSDSVVAGNRAREEITIWKSWKGFVGNLLSDTAGLGNWTFDIHHAYDPRSRTLHFGDGRRRSANALDLTVIRTFAGGAFASPANGDGGPATGARLAVPSGLAVAADGSVYIAEGVGQRVRKVLPNGTITTIVGSLNGQNCGGNTNPCGDGGPALSALLSSPAGIALGPDGALYIADRGSSRIRKVDTNGIIVTIAGTGVAAFTGDGGPATQATLNSPYGVSVGPDGLVYICDTGNSRVRRIGADGIITTIVGGPIIPGVAIGDGGPASQAELNSPYRVTFGSDGSMYIVDRGQGRIRRIGADGIISTVAGTGKISSYGGDGGQAALADLNGPGDIAIAADGSFYIADQGNLRVRLVGPEGVISTFAGTGISGYS